MKPVASAVLCSSIATVVWKLPWSASRPGRQPAIAAAPGAITNWLPCGAKNSLPRARFCRPHIVLTFGPEGGVTGHMDHSMTSVFATLAYHWSGRNNRYPDQLKDGIQPHRVQKLYYGTTNFTLPDRPVISLSPVSAIIDVGKYVETKIQAFRAHASQAPLFPLFEQHIVRRGKHELFHLAAVDHPTNMIQENDLCAEVKED